MPMATVKLPSLYAEICSLFREQISEHRRDGDGFGYGDGDSFGYGDGDGDGYGDGV
jgi:hypothetical protein